MKFHIHGLSKVCFVATQNVQMLLVRGIWLYELFIWAAYKHGLWVWPEKLKKKILFLFFSFGKMEISLIFVELFMHEHSFARKKI